MCFLHAHHALVHANNLPGNVCDGGLRAGSRRHSATSGNRRHSFRWVWPTGSLFNWWAPGRLETNHRHESPEVLWWPPHLQAGVQVSGPLSVQIHQLPAPHGPASPFSFCPSCPFPCPWARHMAIPVPDSLQTWSDRGLGMASDIQRQDWSPWHVHQTDGPTLSPRQLPSKLLLRHPSQPMLSNQKELHTKISRSSRSCHGKSCPFPWLEKWCTGSLWNSPRSSHVAESFEGNSCHTSCTEGTVDTWSAGQQWEPPHTLRSWSLGVDKARRRTTSRHQTICWWHTPSMEAGWKQPKLGHAGPRMDMQMNSWTWIHHRVGIPKVSKSKLVFGGSLWTPKATLFHTTD